MRKSIRFSLTFFGAMLLSVTSFSQAVTIAGTVRNKTNAANVPAVSLAVKGSSQGAFTDENGNFKLTVPKLPVTIIFSSVGFETQEITVDNEISNIRIDFVPASSLGQEVVVSATRTPQRILESPVSIERVNAAAIRNAAAPNYYEGLSNLKGVDMTTSSIAFRTISTRGFNGSGNLRFNQLIDGMDNQAPGLNFSVGSIIGLTELDVDNVELLHGASSALYGSGGLNGTLLITSKNPFKYPGLSFQLKQGANHVDKKQRGIAPYYDWSVRWGKVISDKWAFKVSGQFIGTKDWEAEDKRNLARNNVFSSIKPGDRTTDPNYDGVNVFGDEASASLDALAQAVRFTVASGGGAPALTALNGMLGAGMTPQQIAITFATTPSLAPLSQFLPFLIPTATVANNPFRNTFGGQFVSRTGYDEQELVNYDTYNTKFSGALHYKITNNIEASLSGHYGSGTTVYTGADRYSLKNLKMAQYKAEVKGNNWFIRGYTTQENSGESYTATTAALAINRSWKADATWFQQYTGTYSAGRLGIIPGATPGTFLPQFPDVQAHQASRNAADQGRYLPGTSEFRSAFNNATSTTIKNGGSKFADKSDMYHAEGQYNLTNLLGNVAEVIFGANYRQFILNSKGTIFADTAGVIKINEFGGYLQAARWFFNERLKLTASGRFDKNENFDGEFTPRVTALVKIAPNNNIRLSYQTGYRFPSNQDQWINLNTPGSRLIGGLPDFKTFFNFGGSPAFTSISVVAYRQSISTGTPNPALLKAAEFSTVKPETVNSYEIGYRGLPIKNLLIDIYGYTSQYKDFIARVAVARGQSANPSFAVQAQELASPFTTTNYSFVTNTTEKVKAYGFGVGLEYQFTRGYNVSANFSSDELSNLPTGVVSFFNTPELRYNLGFRNDNVYRNIGFNILYRWQDKVYWEGTFGTGEIPSYSTLDAQVNFKMPKSKSVFKIGVSNLLNDYYFSAFGNPQVGGVYYVSYGFNL